MDPRRGQQPTTIRDVHSPESRADVQIRGAGRDRLGVATPFEAQVGSHVPRSDLTYIGAQDLGEVHETVIHDGQPSLIACAPHGGVIEEYTAQIAALVRKELGALASVWFVRGFGDDASKRWHVTTTEIAPASFPGLATIADQGFDHAVSFHAWDREEVLIGGSADGEIRTQLASELGEAINDTREIMTDQSDCGRIEIPEATIVARLTPDHASGVQIQLPSMIAHQYRKQVARAITRFYDEVIPDE